MPDIWVKSVHRYSLLTELYERDTGSNTELIQLTHNIADPLLVAAREVVRYFEEYDNGEMNDPMKAANRVIRSITTEDSLVYEDICYFETEFFSAFGILANQLSFCF